MSGRSGMRHTRLVLASQQLHEANRADDGFVCQCQRTEEDQEDRPEVARIRIRASRECKHDDRAGKRYQRHPAYGPAQSQQVQALEKRVEGERPSQGREHDEAEDSAQGLPCACHVCDYHSRRERDARCSGTQGYQTAVVAPRRLAHTGRFAWVEVFIDQVRLDPMPGQSHSKHAVHTGALLSSRGPPRPPAI